MGIENLDLIEAIVAVNLIQVISTAQQIRSFLEEDLLTILTEADLRAASNALIAAQGATDKRNAYWSVLTHLEAAEAKLELQMPGGATRMIFYLQAVRAIILKGMNDDGLVKACFDRCVSMAKRHNKALDRSGFRDFLSSINPRNWLRAFRGPSSIQQAANDFDVDMFWHKLGFCEYHRAMRGMVYSASPLHLIEVAEMGYGADGPA